MASIPTSGDDILYTTRTGQTIDGLGGDDHIFARNYTSDRTRLLGNTGDDWLVTTHYDARNYLGVIAREVFQDGGAGNDQLEVTMRYVNEGYYPEPIASTTYAAELAGGAGSDALSLLMFGPTGTHSGQLSGGDGNDRIQASAMSDFAGGEGLGAFVTNTLTASGGNGDDVVELRSDSGPSYLEGHRSVLTATGGLGADTLTARANGSVTGTPRADVTLDGGAGADFLRSDVITGTEQTAIVHVVLRGGGDADRLQAFTGAYGNELDAINLLEGGTGNDRLDAVIELTSPESYSQEGLAENRLNGGDGNDTLRGEIVESIVDGVYRSVLFGGGGADTLRVAGGHNNRLEGGSGTDQLQGGAGVDVLVGGAGVDLLSGGGGADRFIFAATSESTSSARDRIEDFASGDRIHLAGIDAGLAAGDQAFVFGSAGAGRVWVVDQGEDALVHAQTEAGASLSVRVADGADHVWLAGDFFL